MIKIYLRRYKQLEYADNLLLDYMSLGCNIETLYDRDICEFTFNNQFPQ